ncbi:GTP-binding protein [Granulosicoccus antarcticus]|uniref:Metal chaperone YciC n=1 Tax=Granulosicoccus antarcticus IMCC3135 TaxID=1192854 RepID=A0A2Z2NU35_9GAMM|nr:GTP-binding protein [Granulosicoccus antarcticus]ASJ73248.1 Putative metal chaperone YciC [Granulosicoccus antarcticus IMCC3135]
MVEFADVIILNKIDLITSVERKRLDHALRQLNRHANIVHVRFGDVPLDNIIATGRFDFERAISSPGWLASSPHAAGEWSQAGGIVRHGPVGTWWADVPCEHWPDDPEQRTQIEAEFDGEYGDRRQEIVFIGQDLEPAHTQKTLDRCLLNDIEMALGMEAWKRFDESLPRWFGDADEDADTPR